MADQPDNTRPSPAVDNRLVEQLTAFGVRITPARRRVLDVLLSEDGPRSPAEMAGSLPQSTIYRTLTTLTDAGVLVRHHGTDGVTRYEPAEWLRGHHHHVVCGECGSVDDVELPPVSEKQLEALVVEVGLNSGFLATGHTLEIEGVCATCR